MDTEEVAILDNVRQGALPAKLMKKIYSNTREVGLCIQYCFIYTGHEEKSRGKKMFSELICSVKCIQSGKGEKFRVI